MTTQGAVFITRVVLKNYRSIATCDIDLGPLTFLVGPNGSGKSNFLDALRLVTDALQSSLDHALRERGGITEVRRRSGGHPTHFGVRLEFLLPDGRAGSYAFKVGAKKGGQFVVQHESCRVADDFYEVRDGVVTQPTDKPFPPASDDRLYLVVAAGLPQFRAVFDALSHMGFYNISPDQIRELQTPDRGDVLSRDASNLASVVGRLEPERLQRIVEYLGRVVPGIDGFDERRVGHKETIEFRQRVEGSPDPWRFPAINMSDGTLRALAILVGLFQSGVGKRVPFVGIEEPETALHPAAAGILRDCIVEATRNVQVAVTSHSAELLDDSRITADMIRAVQATDGKTEIAPLTDGARSILLDRLFTAGELLRANQLEPDRVKVPSSGQLRLFEDASE